MNRLRFSSVYRVTRAGTTRGWFVGLGPSPVPVIQIQSHSTGQRAKPIRETTRMGIPIYHLTN